MGVWEAGGWEEPELERVLATVLFTDIVGASERRRRQLSAGSGSSVGAES
jgi:class 3 adenylate cyclase